MINLIRRSRPDTGRAAAKDINAGALEQGRIVRGIPLYACDDFCDHVFRVNPGTKTSADSGFRLMREGLHDSKTVTEEALRPIFVEKRNSIDGEVCPSELDPGDHEQRLTVNIARSNNSVQLTSTLGVE